MRALFSFRAMRAGWGGAKMAAAWLWRRLCQGSAFPVSYASRIMRKQYFLPSTNLMGARLAGSHVDTQEPKTNPLVSISDEPETLYKRLSILVKGHDKAVLDSYEYFAVLAAKELGISIEKVDKPPKTIERLTLLKSVHIYKKHRVQYEMRTHYMCLEEKKKIGNLVEPGGTKKSVFQGNSGVAGFITGLNFKSIEKLLKYLTSSTAAVYLEYVQRNLPEGVAMEVKKTKIEKIPEHIRKPVWDTLPQVEETEVKS